MGSEKRGKIFLYKINIMMEMGMLFINKLWIFLLMVSWFIFCMKLEFFNKFDLYVVYWFNGIKFFVRYRNVKLLNKNIVC